MKANYLRRCIYAFVMLVGLFFSNNIMAQKITVTGTVTEAGTGESIIGCSIVEKGTSNGTITDFDGKYSISINKGATLVFSGIGYKRVEVKVKNNVHNVSLESDYATLEEVAVVGYGVQKSMDISSDYARVRVPAASIAYAPQMEYERGYNTEDYGSWSENRFKNPLEEPLSTFSIDVDAASYSNMRRFVNNGNLPPQDAIRTEELINYFSYNYSKPKGNNPVSILTEVGKCPWNEQHKLFRIGLKAKEIAGDNLPASNFVFLIDVSGSMYGPTRLELVKSSLKLLINNLREKDKVAIVVYAGAAGVVLPSTSGGDKQKIREALDKLTAGGSTAGGAGIQLAYKIAKENFVRNGNNRIVLCTDGDFNVGVSSNEGLEQLIEKERQSGVFLTVLGYGMGNYKDSKMQVLAQKGNGNHAYIDNLQEANKVLVNEFGGTMYTVAKDVKLQLEFNPAQVQAYRLIGYESRLLNKEDFNDDTKDAGEMGAGHTVTAFYEIVPVGVKSNVIGSVDDLKYQQVKEKKTVTQVKNSPEMLTVKMRYKEPNEDTSKKIEVSVMPQIANVNTDDFHFAASVAMFGQLLRDSEFKGTGTYKAVINLAEKGIGVDKQGYRREFVRLVQSIDGLKE